MKKKATRRLSPAFGPLCGIRILDSGRHMAGPFAATLAAEFGAEVVHLETGRGELLRFFPAHWALDGRNKLSLGVDLKSAKGREIFLRLVEWADVWIESSLPGTYGKLGLSDGALRRRHRKLVILHVSGYGQSGDPRYIRRAAYDPIGQAFGGLMSLTGLADRHQVPCQRVYGIRDMAEDPHYRARRTFDEWDDPVLGKVKGMGVVPRFSRTPGRVWRGAPVFGQDNVRVLERLGYSKTEIHRFIQEEVVA